MKVNKDSISYCLSSISGHGLNSKPEARFCVHRGFVNERRKPNDASSNPDRPEQTGIALLSCTDIRSPKIDQLIDKQSKVQDGKPASICWWFASTGEQYRIQANAYIYPPPSLESKFPKFMPAGKTLSPENMEQVEFDWEAERRRIFEKISPELKASFLRPAPGKPLEEVPSDQSSSHWPTEITTDAQKTLALDRFALIVLDPLSVDLIKLKVEPNERIQWSKLGDGTWKETPVVP
ncbi:hypothetical protein CROQUDRAFT_503238 [Cronartium quercuum f. sp. fusiforme G11]|uniref:Pyridoxamine 5'-phosphate oxidase Alr4036 family FMN-binding domain-containing protein n=1 Tax=Cronartium quercuum f. sp. fusiforme G11 TaxID=708437 RepID=A0A9P6NXW6_9BASI|nr:hypothetical protein CROQUDRAFT_503238 [Cronartium quercuum f. sp. fusiforme G11]